MQPRKVVLVGWDGADWTIARPLMAAGRMPMLSALVSGGASGPLASLPPYLSPMLWNSIATGKHPAEHGIVGFTEFNVATQKIQPMSSQTRRVKAIWNMLSQEGLRSHVLGWFASHPAERILGTCVAETFAKFPKPELDKEGKWLPIPEVRRGSVMPRDAEAWLAPMRVRAEDLDVRLLEFFIPRVREIDLRRDRRPDQLLERLSELYTFHNAAIATLQEDPDFRFLAVYFHFIDWICHDFMEYGAPRRPEVSQRDFELYSGVVDKAYELQDLLLRELLHEAGPGTTCVLCSDHGFLSGNERPSRTPDVTAGIAAWHRPHGIFAMAGPGIRAKVHLDGATLFDVTPTVLACFGLPLGSDMRGRVLEDAFEMPPSIPKIPSWERQGPPLSSSWGEALSSEDASELLRQFEALGYVDLKGDPFENAENTTRRENAWNLGQALLNDRRPEEALQHLEYAYFQNPEQPNIAVPLARCQARLGLCEEAMQTAETIMDHMPDNPEASLMLADIARSAGFHDHALKAVEQAEREGAAPRRVALEKGLCLLHLERFEDAAEMFQPLFEANPNDGTARLGLIRAWIRLGHVQKVEPLVQALVEQHPGSALAWFSLGQVRAVAKDHVGASEAYARALAIEPAFLNAEIGLTLQERKSLEAAGRAGPFVAQGHDFTPREDRALKLKQENELRLQAIRQDSAKRLAEWGGERARLRAERGQLKMLHPPGGGTAKPDQPPIIIVSGLPRSGTSLMMQMLERGGVPIKTDGQRGADTHNERGYFEWEAIKTLQQNPGVIDEAAGMAVKVVSSQLVHLPRGRRYDIIWMDRPVVEIARSQEKMFRDARPGQALPPLEERIRMLQQHRDSLLDSFREQAGVSSSRIRILEVAHRDALSDPRAIASRVAGFLGDRLRTAGDAAEVVDASLWHHRADL